MFRKCQFLQSRLQLFSVAPNRQIFNFFRKKEEYKPLDSSDTLWKGQAKDSELIKEPDNSLTLSEKKVISKSRFLERIELYLQKYGATHKGYLDFARSAIARMETYNVHEDIDCYKAVLRIFPQGKLITKSFLQIDLGYGKVQQDVVIEMMRKMYKYRVMPDDEIGDYLIKIFGYQSHAMHYYRKHMYWVPKTRYTDPNPTTEFLPSNYDTDPGYITRLAANRICPDKLTQFHTIYSTKSETEPWCMVSAQSDNQRRLMAGLCSMWISQRYSNADKHAEYVDQFKVYLDGPHFFFYSSIQFSYYTLWTESNETRLTREFEKLVRQESRMISNDKSSNEYPLLGLTNESESTNENVFLIDPQTKEKISLLPKDMNEEVPQRALLRDIQPEIINRIPELVEGQNLINSPPMRNLSTLNNLDPINNKIREQIIQENIESSSRRAIFSTREIKPVFGQVYPEPEFNNRWSVMRRTHNIKRLPTRIYERHEQVEGTILAIGVLGPSKNVFSRQERVADFESSNERATFVKDRKNLNEMNRPINLTCLFEKDEADNRIQVASETLLYKWLRHVEERNPAMKYSTIIMRAKKKNVY